MADKEKEYDRGYEEWGDDQDLEWDDELHDAIIAQLKSEGIDVARIYEESTRGGKV